MNERDCKTCVHSTPDGCSAWECEYINRKEAIKAYKEKMENVGNSWVKREEAEE